MRYCRPEAARTSERHDQICFALLRVGCRSYCLHGDARSRAPCHHLRRSCRCWCTIVPAAMQAVMTSSVVSMTLCCSDRANSRAQCEVAVMKVALDSDRLSHSMASAPLHDINAAARELRHGGRKRAKLGSPSAQPLIRDPPCRSRVTPLNLHGAFLARLLVTIL
jgi:hypothetical protein